MLQVWLDDGLVPADQAVVSVFDRGFRSGEGVFETLRAYGDHLFRLDQHLGRALLGASELGFDVGDGGAIREACQRTARANAAHLDGTDSALRLILTPGRLDPASPFPGTTVVGPTVVVSSHPLSIDPAIYDRGIAAVTVPWARPLAHVKALSHMPATLAREHARQRGADEALLTDDEHHLVLEGSASNLFVVSGGALATPATQGGILAGVTRSVVLELADRLGIEIEERPVRRDELDGADEVLLTATTREVVPVVAIDERAVGDGRPGPVTRRLHAAYREEVAREVGA